MLAVRHGGASTNLASQLGPPANFRCNEFGHNCDGGHPRRLAPNNDVTATVTYSGCTSNDSEGYLLSVGTPSRIKALKAYSSPDCRRIHPGSERAVHGELEEPARRGFVVCAASCPWPTISHSCTASDGSFGDPGFAPRSS